PEASPAEAGWPVIELPLVEGEESSVTLTKPASWQILATALVLISAALSLLICRGRPVRILLILGITCALGLLAPSMCAVASSGLFLGALLAAAWLGVSKLSPRQAA